MSALPNAGPLEPQLDSNQIEMLRGLRKGALLPQLLRTWRDQAPQQLTDMKEAIANRDAGSLATLAHGFKSASYSIGAKFVGEACARIEEAARRGEMNNLMQLYAQLHDSFINVQPEIDQYLS